MIDESSRKELARGLFLELHRICNSVDPVATNRDQLVPAMLRHAALQVVVLPEPDHEPSGLCGREGVSGELQPRFFDLLGADADFRSSVVQIGPLDTKDLAWRSLQQAYWQSFWFLEAFNAVRVELEDVGSVDWYRPFMHAACVGQEHKYRQALGMPLAMGGDARTKLMAYSVYTDVVVSGSADPHKEWLEYCRSIGAEDLNGASH